MRQINELIVIRARSSDVWQILEDFGNVAVWAPYMRSSRLLGEDQAVVGMRRSLRHAWGFRLEETVTDWVNGNSFAFTVDRAPFPLRSVRESWSLHNGQGNTRVSCVVEYDLHLRPVGSMLDYLLLRHIIRREIRAGLVGLRQYAERQNSGLSLPDDHNYR